MDSIITIDGASRVENDLRSLIVNARQYFDSAISSYADKVVTALGNENYPARRPGQTYVRTYRMKRGYKKQRKLPAAYQIINTQAYARHVVGDKQAWMHVNRHKKVRDIEKRTRKGLTRELKMELQRMTPNADHSIIVL